MGKLLLDKRTNRRLLPRVVDAPGLPYWIVGVEWNGYVEGVCVCARVYICVCKYECTYQYYHGKVR